MRKYACTASAASGLVAMTIGLAGPALAVPTGVGSADDVVRMLEASGFQVILSPAGVQSLDECAVAAVRPGPQIGEGVAGTAESRDYTTVYVDVKC